MIHDRVVNDPTDQLSTPDGLSMTQPTSRLPNRPIVHDPTDLLSNLDYIAEFWTIVKKVAAEKSVGLLLSLAGKMLAHPRATKITI